MPSSLSGFSKLRKPDRKFKSERLPMVVKPPSPNESIWRTLEDRGATIVPYNNGQMLRINGKLDIYPKSLKYRYTHSRNTPWRLIQDILRKDETPLQAIKRVLVLAPTPVIKTTKHDSIPFGLSNTTLRAVRRYKKSI